MEASDEDELELELELKLELELELELKLDVLKGGVKLEVEVTGEEVLLEDSEADDALLELIVPLVLDDGVIEEVIWEEVLVGDAGVEDDTLDAGVDIAVVLEGMSVIEG